MQKLSDDEVKRIGVQILSYIDKICDENDITYFVFFGTLLGAVRHKGYIPWDDDIDICIPRKDYEKFIQKMRNDPVYHLLCMETDPDYYFHFARVCDKSTILKLWGMREIHNLGVFVDVFPVDSAPPKEEKEAWKKRYRELRRKVRTTTPSTAKYLDYSIKTIKRMIKDFPFRVLYGVNNFPRYKKEFIDWITQYNDRPGDEYMAGITDVLKVEKKYMKKEWISDTVTLPFENIYVKAPVGYEEILRCYFGDYMNYPPEAERITHHHFTAYWK